MASDISNDSNLPVPCGVETAFQVRCIPGDRPDTDLPGGRSLGFSSVEGSLVTSVGCHL